VDCAWWDVNIQQVNRRFKGELWTVASEGRDKHGLYWMRGIEGAGLCRSPECLHVGRNSGYAAIGLAYVFGAARVTLLGFDMQRTGGRNHWHPDHPAPLKNLGVLENWRSLFRQLAIDAKAAGFPIVNASRETALTCFPRQPLEELFP
jgi:hypothetical protein